MNNLPTATKQAIEEALRAGQGDREIERAIGVSRNTVARYRQRLGLPVKPRSYDPTRRLAPGLPPGLRILTDSRGAPVEVRIAGLRLAPVVVEQLGARLDAMRALSGDGRWVCAKHGYCERPECEHCEGEA